MEIFFLYKLSVGNSEPPVIFLCFSQKELRTALPHTQALGKTGVVARVYSDGDLRVSVEGKTWTFNPLCVVPAPRSAEYNNTMRANERQDHTAEGGTSGGGECMQRQPCYVTCKLYLIFLLYIYFLFTFLNVFTTMFILFGLVLPKYHYSSRN